MIVYLSDQLVICQRWSKIDINLIYWSVCVSVWVGAIQSTGSFQVRRGVFFPRGPLSSSLHVPCDTCPSMTAVSGWQNCGNSPFFLLECADFIDSIPGCAIFALCSPLWQQVFRTHATVVMLPCRVNWSRRGRVGRERMGEALARMPDSHCSYQNFSSFSWINVSMYCLTLADF